MAVKPWTGGQFGPLLPDLGEYSNPGLLEAHNVIPQLEGYVFPSDEDDVSDSIGTSITIKGATACAGGEYLYQIYAGDATKLYEINSLDSTPPWGVADRSQKTYSVGDSGWHFVQFGTHLIAIPGADYGDTTSDIQYLSSSNLTGGSSPDAENYGDAMNLDPDIQWPYDGTFANAHLGTYPKQFRDLQDATKSTYVYKARFGCAIDTRLLIAHLYDKGTGTGSSSAEYLPNRVAWSATDDPTLFHDGTVDNGVALSDYQDLFDDWGPITGVSGGRDYTLIFKARGIWRMVAGGPFQYSFQPIPDSLGTRWSHSIVRVGNDVFFWGPSGPAVYRGSTHSVEEIGLGTISRALRDGSWVTNGVNAFDPDNVEEWILKASVDASNGLILWTYPKTTGALPDAVLAYNYLNGRFSTLDAVVVDLTDNTQEIYYQISIPDSARDYSLPRDIVTFRHDKTTSNAIKCWWGVAGSGISPSAASVLGDSYRAPIPGVATYLARIRPVFSLNDGVADPDNDWPAITITIRSRNAPWESPVSTSAVLNTTNQTNQGWMTFPSCPAREFHSIEFSFAAANRNNVAEIERFEVEFKAGGTR